MTECDEVAANMPLSRQLSYTEALARIKSEMPDETFTIQQNVAWSLAQRSLALPPTFKKVTESRYDEMLNVLPPLAWCAKGFLVGEAYSHTVDGHATYTAMVQHRGRFYESQGSMTIAVWRAFDPRSLV